MQVVNLADRSAEDIVLVGQWLFNLEGPEQPDPVQWFREFRAGLARRELPRTFVALEHGRILGTASLVRSALPALPQYAPWLAALYLPPEGRGRGVGAALVSRVAAEAAALGFPRLHFQTTAPEAGYARHGWRSVDWIIVGGRPVTVLALDLGRGEQAA